LNSTAFECKEIYQLLLLNIKDEQIPKETQNSIQPKSFVLFSEKNIKAIRFDVLSFYLPLGF
jgi:hypothetical protein